VKTVNTEVLQEKTVRQISLVLVIGLSQVTLGCVSWFGGDSAETPVVAEDPKKTDYVDEYSGQTSTEEMELKIAKLWSKVSELEEQVFRQRERVVVLEKGLMLGLVPEELKNPPAPAAPKPPKAEPKAQAPVSEVKASPLTKEELERYRDQMSKAHELFRSGRYGVAIKAFSVIDEEFGSKLEDGIQRYWIARSWTSLKEYSIAHQQLVEFMRDYPASAFIPRARLEMARIEIKQGLRETAIDTLRKIIDQYPYEDAAEMAKMELQRLDTTL